MKIRHLLLVVATLLAPAVASSTTDIYRYHGLRSADNDAARDGIYQDFRHDGDNLGKMWSDPDGALHGSADSGWVRARVFRDQETPYLRLEFDREGYGVNTGISPRKRIPEWIPANGKLIFEARSANGACAGIRIMERDAEIWAYGKSGLKYERICLPPRSDWTRFEVPLKEPARWFKFPYDGNIELGNNRMEADLIAGLSLELGTYKSTHLGRGAATLDIRDIRITVD